MVVGAQKNMRFKSQKVAPGIYGFIQKECPFKAKHKGIYVLQNHQSQIVVSPKSLKIRVIYSTIIYTYTIAERR